MTHLEPERGSSLAVACGAPCASCWTRACHGTLSALSSLGGGPPLSYGASLAYPGSIGGRTVSLDGYEGKVSGFYRRRRGEQQKREERREDSTHGRAWLFVCVYDGVVGLGFVLERSSPQMGPSLRPLLLLLLLLRLLLPAPATGPSLKRRGSFHQRFLNGCLLCNLPSLLAAEHKDVTHRGLFPSSLLCSVSWRIGIPKEKTPRDRSEASKRRMMAIDRKWHARARTRNATVVRIISLLGLSSNLSL